MLVGNKIVPSNVLRMRKLMRPVRSTRFLFPGMMGLGDINVATTPPDPQTVQAQLQKEIDYYNYVVDQYVNHNHYGGQSAEWFANFQAEEQSKIASLQNLYNTSLTYYNQQAQANQATQAAATAAQQAAQAKSANILQSILTNTGLLTPSSAGYSITPTGPTSTELLKSQNQASSAIVSAVSQPSSYSKGAQQASVGAGGLPSWVLIAGAGLALMFLSKK